MFLFGTGFSSTGQRKRVFLKRNKVSELIVDETVFKVGNEFVILWIAIEPSDKMTILGIHISAERTILLIVEQQFLQNLV